MALSETRESKTGESPSWDDCTLSWDTFLSLSLERKDAGFAAQSMGL